MFEDTYTSMILKRNLEEGKKPSAISVVLKFISQESWANLHISRRLFVNISVGFAFGHGLGGLDQRADLVEHVRLA